MVFVLDESRSVTSGNFDKMKYAVKNFIRYADIDGGKVRVGINVFGTASEIAFNLNTYNNKNDIFAAIDSINYKGSDDTTNTRAALDSMRFNMFTVDRGDRPDAADIAIVITDGRSSSDPIPSADAARNAGIHIIAIGIGDDVDSDELEGIANKPSEDNVFTIDGFDQLDGLEEKVYTAICGKTIKFN